MNAIRVNRDGMGIIRVNRDKEWIVLKGNELVYIRQDMWGYLTTVANIMYVKTNLLDVDDLIFEYYSQLAKSKGRILDPNQTKQYL
ncbi:MAG: hypothetical protein ACK4FV_06985 [Candidatus Nitrosocaldus sp.]